LPQLIESDRRAWEGTDAIGEVRGDNGQGLDVIDGESALIVEEECWPNEAL
jgi:hypothetical protein